MPAPIVPRRDIDFLLFDWLGVGALFEREAYADHARETVDALVDLAFRIATDLYLPLLKESDRVEPAFDATGGVTVPKVTRAAVRATAEAGLFAAGFSAAQGGMAVPMAVFWASMGVLQAASASTAAFMMLTVGNARLILTFGSPAQIAAFAAPQVEGRWCGTMCLSEPQAGSSLADITCRATPDGEDALGRRFRLRGNKMWISAGDHDASENIVHLVLAKVPGPDGKPIPGTKGISLFIVPKHLPDGARNDIVVAGLNHKMGFRGTPNCLLNFGETAGATGWLIGDVGQGLPIMFQMMNEARIGVGLGAAMAAVRGYQLALAYAGERLQGRPLDAKSRVELPPVPLIRHPDVKRMLLAQKAYAEGAMALVLYAGRLLDEERTAADELSRHRAGALLSLLTPVVKTWPSEWGLAANDLAIQVHGGYGYTRDFDVEQLYRDNRLNAIHEGTTGIQGLDLLGRKILRERAASLQILTGMVADTSEAARADYALHAGALDAAWSGIGRTVARLLALNDDASALAHATPFLSAFGHAVVGWLWLDQTLVAHRLLGEASGADAAYLRGKIRACRFFFETELPRVQVWLDQVEGLADTAAGMPADEF